MPVFGLKIQAQIVPVTTNDSAIGRRKMLRNTTSPRMCWSSRIASRRPITTLAMMNATVNTAVLNTSFGQKRAFAKSAW